MPVVEVASSISVVVIASLGVVSFGVRVGDHWPVGVAVVRPSRVFDLVSDLTTGLSAAKLAMRLETVVPVNTDHHAVKDLPVKSIDSEGGLLTAGVLHEAEATRLHFHPVQAHDQVDHLAARREKLEQLAL